MEDLTSHGYVVVAPSHPYDGAVVLPNGRSPGPGEHLVRRADDFMADLDLIGRETEALVESTDPATRRAALGRWRERRVERTPGGWARATLCRCGWTTTGGSSGCSPSCTTESRRHQGAGLVVGSRQRVGSALPRETASLGP